MTELRRISVKLDHLVIEIAENNIAMANSILQLQEMKESYIELRNRITKDGNEQRKLSEFGNEISIVFQNTELSDNNVLFTGDFGKIRNWRYIENNPDGLVRMHDTYSIIKVPHHGTKRYYHNFVPIMTNNSRLLIPHGSCRNWNIHKLYSVDVNGCGAMTVCSESAGCNACLLAGRTCINNDIIEPRFCLDI